MPAKTAQDLRIANQRKRIRDLEAIYKSTSKVLAAVASKNPELGKEALKDSYLNTVIFVEALVQAEQEIRRLNEKLVEYMVEVGKLKQMKLGE
jgi:hypothetical protein